MSRRGGNSSQTRSDNIRCYRCQQTGHIGRYCPKFGDHVEASNSQTRQPSEKSSRGAAQGELWLLTANLSGDCKLEGEWILDTAATDHISNARHRFQNFRDVETVVRVASGSAVTAKGIGDITITLSGKCGGKQIILQNVLYVPELLGNVISMTKVTKNGNYVEMDEDTITIFNQLKEITGIGYRRDDLYFTMEPGVSRKGKCQSDRIACVAKRNLNLDILHRRLGHQNKSSLRKWLEVKGGSDKPCDMCRSAKATAKPFPKYSRTRALKEN